METVLITGAARRVGAMMAENLASKGHFVWIHYRNGKDDAEALCKRIRNLNGMAECIRADLLDTQQIDQMLTAIRKSDYNNITTVINNASLFHRETIRETSVQDWDRVMGTNLKAVWYLSAQIANTFDSVKRIINIGDASISSGMSGHAVYGLSKYALKFLTEQMAAAYAPDIRINLLSPGLVMRGDAEPMDIWEKRLHKNLTDNADIQNSLLRAVHFLMTDPGITGSEIFIDNGLHIRFDHNQVSS